MQTVLWFIDPTPRIMLYLWKLLERDTFEGQFMLLNVSEDLECFGNFYLT